MKCGLCEEYAFFHIQVDKRKHHLCKRHMEEFTRTGKEYQVVFMKASDLLDNDY